MTGEATVRTGSITRLDSEQGADLEPTAALLQRLHRHLQPEAVLAALWHHCEPGRQGANLASGMRFRCPANGPRDQGLDIHYGDGVHGASYDLEHQGDALGELCFYFRRRADEATLRGIEDLIALAMPALRNALDYRALAQKTAPTDAVAVRRAAPRRSKPADVWDDAVVLVSLDGFDDIRACHGAPWAQTLIDSLQQQISDGLRDADSVFQIEPGLLAVLLPNTSKAAASDVAAKIRVLIAGLHLKDGRVSSQLTACMGIAGARDLLAPEEVLDQARQALVRARQESPNTIRCHDA